LISPLSGPPALSQGRRVRSQRREQGLRLGEFGELSGRREALDRRRQHGERIVQAPEPGISLACTRFGFGQRRFEIGHEVNHTLLLKDGEAASHLGESRHFGTLGPLCPALIKYRAACPKGEIVSRHDIGQRLGVGRDCFGVAAKKPQPRRECEHKTHRRSMRCRLGVGEGAVGKPQSLVDSTEHP
jgi:hypothetical protein